MIAYPLVVLSIETSTPELSASKEIAKCFTCAKVFPLTITFTNSLNFQCKCMFSIVPSKTSLLPVIEATHVNNSSDEDKIQRAKSQHLPTSKYGFMLRPILRNTNLSSSVIVSKSVGRSSGSRYPCTFSKAFSAFFSFAFAYGKWSQSVRQNIVLRVAIIASKVGFDFHICINYVKLTMANLLLR